MNEKFFDLMVIGSGFTGMASALFAAEQGLRVAQVGSTGGIDFSTGLIDLMAVHPIDQGKIWENPWEAIQAVTKDCPQHPYCLLSREEIETSINKFCNFLQEQGLAYTGYEHNNTKILTPLGGIKSTYKVPATAWNGVLAMQQKAPTLIVDFYGLKGFSGTQIVQLQQHNWPELKTMRINFPGYQGELYPEHLAWSIKDDHVCQQIADRLRPHIQEIEYIGFPAILGLKNPMHVVENLQQLTGKKIFEIPTLPPSIAGTRLRAAFDRGLHAKGVKTFSQKMVLRHEYDANKIFNLHIGKKYPDTVIRSKAVLLASGRFLGKGLQAKRTKIQETIFDLHVRQPENRYKWHKKHFFNLQGHAINKCGLKTDKNMRPVNSSGKLNYDNLYAAGGILAGHDWMRMKCGAGLAISTAYKAVREICKQRAK